MEISGDEQGFVLTKPKAGTFVIIVGSVTAKYCVVKQVSSHHR